MGRKPDTRTSTRIGLVTIGQSPRDDIVPTFRKLLPEDVQLIESGVLDSFDDDDLVDLWPQSDEVFFVSRLRNGGSARVSTTRILPILQQQLDGLVEEQVTLLVMLCAGFFPSPEAEVPIIFPDKVLWHFVRRLGPAGLLGVIASQSEQFPLIQRKWDGYELELRAHNPYQYDRERMWQVAASLAHCPWIVLDGMAYTPDMARTGQEASGTFVILPQWTDRLHNAPVGWRLRVSGEALYRSPEVKLRRYQRIA